MRNLFGTLIGLVVGIVTAFMLVFPMIELFTCDSFWEQGCDPRHNLKLFGSLGASGLGGFFAGWGAADLFNRLIAKLRRS